MGNLSGLNIAALDRPKQCGSLELDDTALRKLALNSQANCQLYRVFVASRLEFYSCFRNSLISQLFEAARAAVFYIVCTSNFSCIFMPLASFPYSGL
jgi:hypothetical protein